MEDMNQMLQLQQANIKNGIVPSFEELYERKQAAIALEMEARSSY